MPDKSSERTCAAAAGSRGVGAFRTLSLRATAIYFLPATVSLAWLVIVLATGTFGRALDHWESAVTMAFGSFLAGSSPGGGGAVAFPVFTKVLDVSAPVARTFALCIQAVGMTAAAAVTLLARRPIEPRAVLVGATAGSAGFLAALVFLGDHDTPFLAPSISAPYVKVTFTIILASMSYLMFLSLRSSDHGRMRVPHWNWRVWLGLAVAGALGGALSSLTGTGVNVLLFLFIVVMAGLHPSVGVPTSIIAMAIISVVGLVSLGLVDGQLNVALSPDGREVVSVAGEAVAPLEASRYDLLGLWLAAVPIVAWGAPLGTYAVHRFRANHLVVFVGTLAAVEVITTFLLLDELRSDLALLGYALGGLAIVPAAISLLKRHRHRILALTREELAG